jgi:hypothetical protein
VLLVPLVTTFVYISIHEGDNSRSYVPELKKIADQTSLYPGFRSSGEKVVLKRDMAYLFTYYQCDAQFADVQAFYARVLPHQGWSPPRRTNSIMFDAKITSLRWSRTTDSQTGSQSYSYGLRDKSHAQQIVGPERN